MSNNFNWTKLGIDVTHIRREGKTTCPKCGPTRKNKRDKSLSVNVITGDYCCHNSPCDFRGNAGGGKYLEQRERREYTKPQPRLQQVSDQVVKWFEGRGISNNTLLQMKVTEAVEWMPQSQKEQRCICFNYFRGEELINIKFRTGDKNFKMSKDAEPIFYNLNSVKQETAQGWKYRTAVGIVEGEVDALTAVECGVYGVLSVPNGANQLREGEAPRLEYLDNCWDELAQVEYFIIATDDDVAGRILKNELIRRLGAARCYTVVYPEGCKDLNEVLMKFGKEAVRKMFEDDKLQPAPLESIISSAEMEEDADHIFNHGYPTALGLGWQLDDHFKFLPGDITVVTGIPNHGKSTWVNNVCVQLAQKHSWRIGMYSPEKVRGGFLMTELAAMYIGEPSTGHNKMSPGEWSRAKGFIREHFFFIKTTGINLTITALLSYGTDMVQRYGINMLVLDPWNYVETDIPIGQPETVWLGQKLGIAAEWAKTNNVHLVIVAHPTKMPRDKNTQKYLVPNLYDISGSAHWSNKVDNGITVYRDTAKGCTEVYIQKVRWFFVGRAGGKVTMTFNPQIQRFTDYEELTPEKATYEEIRVNQMIRDRGREILQEQEEQIQDFTESKDLPF